MLDIIMPLQHHKIKIAVDEIQNQIPSVIKENLTNTTNKFFSIIMIFIILIIINIINNQRNCLVQWLIPIGVVKQAGKKKLVESIEIGDVESTNYSVKATYNFLSGDESTVYWDFFFCKVLKAKYLTFDTNYGLKGVN